MLAPQRDQPRKDQEDSLKGKMLRRSGAQAFSQMTGPLPLARRPDEEKRERAMQLQQQIAQQLQEELQPQAEARPAVKSLGERPSAGRKHQIEAYNMSFEV